MKNNVMTDWDVKKSYAETTEPFFFPVIFIDEYWNHYMKLFGQERMYEKFKYSFKKDNFTYQKYMHEYGRTVQRCADELLTVTPDRMKHITDEYISKNNINPDTDKLFPKSIGFNFPDGRYLQVDMHNAFDIVMKKLGVFNMNYENTDEVIMKKSKYEIFKGMKEMRMAIYRTIFDSNTLRNMFLICADDFLKKIYLSDNDDIRYLRNKYPSGVRSLGDMYMYNIGNDDVNKFLGDHVYEGISVRLSIVEVKTVYILGNRCKTLYMPDVPLVNYRIGWSYGNILPPEIISPVLVLAKNKTPDKMDLAIGNEDKIYFYLNENDCKI